MSLMMSPLKNIKPFIMSPLKNITPLMTSPLKNMALKEATHTRHHNEENNEHTMAIEEKSP